MNSKGKESYIDRILKLEGTHQTLLMEMMVKYTNLENTKKPATFEADVIENLQLQLKAKETDHLALIEHLSKFEEENKELAAKLGRTEDKCRMLSEENRQLQEEFDRVRHSAMEAYSSSEKELEVEVGKLSAKLEGIKSKLKGEQERCSEFENKLQDEVNSGKQKDLKIESLDSIIEKQKEELELLKGVREEKSDVESSVEGYMRKVEELVKHNKELADECESLAGELQGKRTECKSALENYKREQEANAKITEKLTMLQDRNKYLEEVIKQAENKINLLNEESESLRKSSERERFAPAELKYQQKISRLEEQVVILSESADIKFASQITKLEAELKAKTASEKEFEQELSTTTGKYETLQKEYTSLLEEFNKYRVNNAPTDIEKEFARVKKDRDTLLQVAANAQDISTKYDQLKKEHKEIQNAYKELEERYNASMQDKCALEGQLKTRAEESLELERSKTRLEEKIAMLQEEYESKEVLIKDVIQRPDVVKQLLTQ